MFAYWKKQDDESFVDGRCVMYKDFSMKKSSATSSAFLSQRRLENLSEDKMRRRRSSSHQRSTMNE